MEHRFESDERKKVLSIEMRSKYEKLKYTGIMSGDFFSRNPANGTLDELVDF